MFSRIAPGYDTFNRLASLGLDRLWRRAMLDAVASKPSVKKILDVGTGTGDLIFDAFRQASWGAQSHYLGIDLSQEMLAQARKKSQSVLGIQSEWQCETVERLSFRADQFDVAMSAFVIRNIKKILPTALQEILRVLKPGGQIVILEMFRPQSLLLRWGHTLYMNAVLPIIGRCTLGRAWPKNYLKETIQAQGVPENIRRALEEAGFIDLKVRSLCGGIAAIIQGKKRN